MRPLLFYKKRNRHLNNNIRLADKGYILFFDEKLCSLLKEL